MSATFNLPQQLKASFHARDTRNTHVLAAALPEAKNISKASDGLFKSTMPGSIFISAQLLGLRVLWRSVCALDTWLFYLVRMLPAEKKEPWDADLTVELPQIDRAGCAFRDSHVKKSQIEWPESVVDR